MISMSRLVAVGLGAAAIFATAPAQATQIPDGTVSAVGLFTPTINLVADPHTFSAAFGTTFQITGDGGFTGVGGHSGTLNGTVDFSGLVGTTIDQNVADLFTFNDGFGGLFQFSVTSVKTVSYAVSSGSSAIGIYLLGNTVDTNPLHLFDPTLTSLTLTFGSTGGSPYSASATLSVPPAVIPGVPETTTWALTLMGFGAMGAAMRRRPRTSVSFA